MKTFVIGDIHGGYKALIQCLVRSNFNYNEDELIVLGDIVDGWPETPEAIEEILKIKNRVILMGNHDEWCKDWLEYGSSPIIWTEQGGKATIEAYLKRNGDLMTKHRDSYFKEAQYYYIDEKDRLFVHAGVPNFTQEPATVDAFDLVWNRSLADGVFHGTLDDEAMNKYPASEIYIGHTTTSKYSNTPIVYKNKIFLLDTGGGWEGKLSIMNVDTKEFWQSDKVSELYPNNLGR